MSTHTLTRAITTALLLVGPMPVAVGTGCSSLEANDAAASPADMRRQPILHVCGIDRSASYRRVPAGVTVCKRVVDSTQPGDVVIIRYISDKTYLNEEEIARVDLRDLAADACSNPFDARCAGRARASQRMTTLRLASLRTRLDSLAPKPAPATDIIGLAAAAADAARALPSHRLELTIASDMLDNVRYRFNPDLSGAKVLIAAFQTSLDPGVTDRRRREMERQFRRWGATEVQVTSASQE